MTKMKIKSNITLKKRMPPPPICCWEHNKKLIEFFITVYTHTYLYFSQKGKQR